MTTIWNDLFGDVLIENIDQTNENDQPQEKTKTIQTTSLSNKIIGIYFSAHWCGPCRYFTPQLAEFYKENRAKHGDLFEIVFASLDENQESFDEYFKEMPWKALPFSDRDRSKTLGTKYQVEGIPSLIIFSSTGEKITAEGVEEFRANKEKSFENWTQGKSLFWSKENTSNEYAWEDTACDQCFLRPIIGNRFHYRDQTKNENLSLCQDCASKLGAVEKYLTPKQSYSIEEIFRSVPYLVQPGSKEQISKEDLWKNNPKTIGIYFSAHWCPPCRSFTPKLAEVYKQASIALSSDFRLVFASCDQDKDSFNEYHASMPWPAIPFENSSIIKEYFQYSGIPSLFVLSSNGKILTRRGRDDIMRKGLETIQYWSKGEKVPSPPPDQFEWGSVTCDGCRADPLIGLRYYCSTCGNYDLCSECQKKGHEHPLTLVPQPNDDDD